MTFKDMKKMLLRYPAMTEKVNGIKREMELTRDSIVVLREGKAVVIDGMPHGYTVSDSTCQKVEKIMDIYEKRMNELCDEVEEIIGDQQRVTDLLRWLDPDEYRVIKARYIDGIKWDYIPGEIYISRKQCFRIHDKAVLKMIAKIQR